MNSNLAEKLRPTTIEDIVGQDHILKEGKPLRSLIDSGNICNIILYGKPGCGKSSLLRILANQTKRKCFSLNGTTASVKDIQQIISDLRSSDDCEGGILFFDELSSFSRQRQATLLSYIEANEIILIASTSENPYHSINNALLSRCMVFEFKPVDPLDIVSRLMYCMDNKLTGYNNVTYELEALDLIAEVCKGDLRKAIGILELILLSLVDKGESIHITLKNVEDAAQQSMSFSRSDYYDCMSFLQKSIRGGSVDGALFSLSLLLVNNVPLDDILRRIAIIASEQGLGIGNLYSTVASLLSMAKMVGMPEASVIVSHAVIILSTVPKGPENHLAIKAAMEDARKIGVDSIPMHLRDNHYKGAKSLGVVGYKNPFDYPNNYVAQQYMPDILKDKTYYIPGNNKFEKAMEQYLSNIKKNTLHQ